MFHCMLVCAFSFPPARIQGVYAPLMGFSPLGDGNADSRLRSPFRSAHERSKPFTMGFPLLGVPILLWDFPHSESYQIPILLLGFSPLGGQKFVGIADEISPPTQKQCCKIIKSSPYRIKHFEVKDQHSEET